MQTKHRDYFEGILQLRNVDNKIIEFTIKDIEKQENIFISNIKKITNGIDIYVSSQRYLRNLGNKLQNRFGGQLIISTKLHTRNRISSKEVYRVNALFRVPKFKKDDIIEYKGSKIKIISINKKIFAKDIKTGKKLNINFKDMFRSSNF